MATRAQLRTTLRERLEDTSGTPLWADTALNEFLTAAMRAYGATFPRQAAAATAALVAGNTSVALPTGIPERGIVAVRDAHGRDVPKATERQGPAPADATGLMQAWSVWAGTLRLQRPVGGDEVGAWAIDYLGGRELVGDDVSQQPIEAGDEPIVVAHTCRLMQPSSVSENNVCSLLRSRASSFLVCPYAVFPSWGVSRTPGGCRHDGGWVSCGHQGWCRGDTRSGPRERCCPPSGMPLGDAADTVWSKIATHSRATQLTTR
jgi:hypothetical protein